MRKTKIICTLGPAVDSPEVLERLIKAGMNVARINFSHGNYEEQKGRINNFKKVRNKLGLPIPLLLDTKGPEIRIGKFENNIVELQKGSLFTLTNQDILGNAERVSITYKNLYNEVNIGTTILVNDGTIELKVKQIINKDIICEIINGGKLTNTKSVNIPTLNINLPSMTEKDIEDIKFGILEGFDYIAVSFVRKPEDVLDIKDVLKEHNGEHIKVISKIENRQGIENFDKILEVSDGIMIARGDLGVEIPMEEVPIRQKEFIKKCYKLGKPVITATQMLESMINNPRPTRAEVSDVANAIYDGSSSIMLSGESAMGKYPVECVETMNTIAIAIEGSINYWERFKERNKDRIKISPEFEMNYSMCVTAINMEAKAIIAYTETGNTARILSSFGTKCPIYAITENRVTYRQLALCWNITPLIFDHQNFIEDLLELGIEQLKSDGVLNEDDLIVIAGGSNIIPNLNESNTNKVLGGILKI